MDEDRYVTCVVEKYLASARIKYNSKFHKTTLPHDMICNKEDDYTSDKQVEVLSIE